MCDILVINAGAFQDMDRFWGVKDVANDFCLPLLYAEEVEDWASGQQTQFSDHHCGTWCDLTA
jgi:hypothetical protein